MWPSPVVPGGQLCRPVPVLPHCSRASEEQQTLPWGAATAPQSTDRFPWVIPRPVCPWEASSFRRFQMIEIRGKFRLKVIWVLAGLAGLVCFTTDQATFCCCHAGRSQMPQAWDLAGFIPTPSVVRSRLSLNCRIYFTVQQKCLGFMMCVVHFFTIVVFFSLI